MTEKKDYIFVENDLHSDQYSIKLLSGRWAGVIYTYGRTRLTEDKEADVLKVSFVYKIESTPEGLLKESLDDDSDFKNYIGDVLNHLLSQSEFKIGNNDAKES